MTETTAEQIRDDLIEQAIRYKRVDAGVARDATARLGQLERDLKALWVKIDPGGTTRRDARDRRLKKLRIESGKLTRTAYSEINQIIRSASRRVAKVEANQVNRIVEKRLP